MVMPRRYPLKVNHPYEEDHDADVFKSDFRTLTGETSAEAETRVRAYFTALGDAGTLTFGAGDAAVNGVDFEFNADGYKSLTADGAAKLIISDIITGDEMKYLFIGGMSMDFQLKTSEWEEPATAVSPPYNNPVPHMNGTAADTASDYLMTFYQNNTTVCSAFRNFKDTATYQTKGENKLQFLPTPTLVNPATCSRPISSLNKGTYINVRATWHDNVGNYWIDQMPACPPSGSGNPSFAGARRTRSNSSTQTQKTHTTPDAFIVIGNFIAGNAAFCTKSIRNIRLYKTQTDLAITPKLEQIVGFGDSFLKMGATPSSSGIDVTIGRDAASGEYSTVSTPPTGGFADINCPLRFTQLMTQAGYQVGELINAGQGGYHFTAGEASSLFDDGFKDTLIERYQPSMVFTFGLNNDIARVAAATLEVADLRDSLIADYIKPVLDKGCHGWGFVIAPPNKAAIDSDNGVAYNLVGDMLLALPATFDAAATAGGYTQHIGKVKVRDIRTTMGNGSTTNINWDSYFTTGEDVHPSPYGQVLFAEACAEMAKEWLAGV